MLLPADDPKRYHAFVAATVEEFAPASAIEAALVRELADVKWKVLRLAEAESAAAWGLFPDGDVSADFVRAWTAAEVRLNGRMIRVLRQLAQAREQRRKVEGMMREHSGAEQTDFAPSRPLAVSPTMSAATPTPRAERTDFALQPRAEAEDGWHGHVLMPVENGGERHANRACAERTDFDVVRDGTRQRSTAAHATRHNLE